jgi:hypothetical protein
MKQVLEVLNNNRRKHYSCEDSWYSCPKDKDGCANDQAGDDCTCGADKANLEIDAAIAVLRQSIEQAEKQEPVAWMDEEWDVLSASVVDGNGLRNIPLYTAPPQRKWVGLTEEEIRGIAKQYALNLAFPYDSPTTPEMFARAIEAKLRENNT